MPSDHSPSRSPEPPIILEEYIELNGENHRGLGFEGFFLPWKEEGPSQYSQTKEKMAREVGDSRTRIRGPKEASAKSAREVRPSQGEDVLVVNKQT